tara:strand:- start:446 stop:1324 length:879 start_codon:yes stop_codon:yes gene_type:complete
MGKKYMDTKDGTLESSILGVWQEAAKKNEDKLDPVNKDAVKKDFDDRKDKDIDNDGDVDSTDKYLHKRRKAVSKAIAKEGLEDSPNPANSWHLCAKNVVHEEWGYGECVPTMHADPDEEGNIAWYDVMFEHGLEKGVEISELTVKKSESHHHAASYHGNGKKKLAAMAHGDKKKLDAMAHGDKKKLDAMAHGDKKKLAAMAHGNKKESYEIGTDEYREYTQKLTPGQEIQKYGDFKVQSMKEALKKVWGLDEKRLDKTEEDDKIAPVKGKKSMTGGDVADVKVDPEMKKESK